MNNIFIELGVVLSLATGFSIVARLIKQPLIVSYIVAGIVAGPYFLNLVGSTGLLESFSELGIALLLFIVGLNLSPRVIKEVGKVSLVTGGGQVIITTAIGFVIAKLFGMSTIESFYVSSAFAFSSTIIVLKLLSDKKDLDALYGKICVGFLLVQDVIAALILIVVSSSSKGQGVMEVFLRISSIGFITSGILIMLTVYLLPKLSDFFAKSQEILFLFSITYGIGMAAIFYLLGFSIEIGALVAGVTLTFFPYHREIAAKMKPLRDFFVTLFFISLGLKLSLVGFENIIFMAIIFSIFVLVGNAIILMILMGFLGYRRKVSFMTGLMIAQISEFSLILIALGSKLGHVGDEAVTLVVIVGMITIVGSVYMIMHAEVLYKKISRYLPLFEKARLRKVKTSNGKFGAILLGYSRVGREILDVFGWLKLKCLVVDYNPEVIKNLANSNIQGRYGDVGDEDFLDELNFDYAKVVVSTIPNFDVNVLLIDKLKATRKKIIIIVLAHDPENVKRLYNKGATYVIVPHMIGGRHVHSLLKKHRIDIDAFMVERKKYMKDIGN